METLLEDGFWSVFGAIIGAFLGALFGFVVLIYSEYRKKVKLEKTFYSEVNFLSRFMGTFLSSVVREYEQGKVDIKDDSYSGPAEIDFNVFNTLHLELYKAKNMLTNDHRLFIHNISLQWDSIHSLDKNRIVQFEETTIYTVNHARCKEIVYRLVSLIYHFDRLIHEKDKFKFDQIISFDKKAHLVFNKLEINNDQLIKIMSIEMANHKH